MRSTGLPFRPHTTILTTSFFPFGLKQWWKPQGIRRPLIKLSLVQTDFSKAHEWKRRWVLRIVFLTTQKSKTSGSKKSHDWKISSHFLVLNLVIPLYEISSSCLVVPQWSEIGYTLLSLKALFIDIYSQPCYLYSV